MNIIDLISALKILKKVLRWDASQLTATLDGNPFDKTDVDAHFFRYDLEAWRNSPKEYFRCEVPYHDPKHVQVKVDGHQKFQEKGDADLTGNTVSLEISYADNADGSGKHMLKFVFPYI